MSNPEAPQPEAVSEAVSPAVSDVGREQSREERHESPQDPSQRQFLKTLFGSAAGIAGLAVAGELMNPAPAEAAYTVGGATTFFNNVTSTPATGDLVNTHLRVDGHLAVKGFRPWVDVTAYTEGRGFAATGPVDSGVQAAFAALADIGGIIYFPPGHYYFENPIDFPSGHITLAGAGRGHTVLVFSGANGGLKLDHGHSSYTVTIRDLTFQANVATGPAIHYKTVWSEPWLSKIHIHDVEIRGKFGKGIELMDASGAKIERFDISGDPSIMTQGIHLLRNPEVVSGGSSIVNIASGFITGCDTGIEVGDVCEGTYIRGVEVVGGRVGYKLISPSPGSAISDCHAATTEHGIYILNHGEMALIGNLLYGGGASTQWTGIHAEGTGGAGDNGVSARRLRIIGNTITSWEGAPSPTRMGIYMKDAVHDCTIQGNSLTFLTHGIVLTGTGTNNNIVLGNRIRASLGGWFPAGTGNVFEHNIVTAT